MLQVQILVVDHLAVVFAVPVATMAAKLHVPGHALQLVLETAVDRVPEVVIIHAPVIALVVVVDVAVVVVDALEIVDLVVMVVVVECALLDAVSPVQAVVEQVAADSAEAVASSVIVNGGLYA